MKILVRATNWVGDAVMSIPALRAIRGRWPDAEIMILARPWVADLYREQGYADRILVYDNKNKHKGFWGREWLAHALRREKFDVAVLFQNAFDAAWIAWRARIPERIGYAQHGRSWLLTRAIPTPVKGEAPDHEAYDYLELLRRAGWLEHQQETSPRHGESHAEGESEEAPNLPSALADERLPGRAPPPTPRSVSGAPAVTT